jgi:hypothetical protein
MADQTIHSQNPASRRDAACFGKRPTPSIEELKRGKAGKAASAGGKQALRLAPTLLAMSVLLGFGHDRVIAAASLAEGCAIKGTITVEGDKLYRLAGDDGYAATHVSFLRGERWFCSEADARGGGWHRAAP